MLISAVNEFPFPSDETGEACDRGHFCLSHLDQMPTIINHVIERMERLGYPSKDLFGMRLALEEAICNAIKHGHQNDRSKTAQVRYRVSKEHVWIAVEDEGPGFDPG